MKKLIHYTVVTIDRQQLPFETRWLNPLAAGKFAERRYADPRVRTVAIFAGEIPEQMPDPRSCREMLLFKSKPV